jgi:hypothetical protein
MLSGAEYAINALNSLNTVNRKSFYSLTNYRFGTTIGAINEELPDTASDESERDCDISLRFLFLLFIHTNTVTAIPIIRTMAMPPRPIKIKSVERTSGRG